MLRGLLTAPSGAFDYMLVGLGNPGREYENTRHNIGFRSMDLLCEKHQAECKRLKFKALIGETRIGQSRCLLLKPQTFMNLSGQSVTEAMAFYKLPPERVIVIFDDVSLDVGRLRIRAKGSDGGHNGMKNIIYLSGSDAFPRIKIGVGKKPRPEYDLKDWVLGRFPAEQQKTMEEMAALAAEAAESLITDGIVTAMNRYNR